MVLFEKHAGLRNIFSGQAICIIVLYKLQSGVGMGKTKAISRLGQSHHI
jgi:hypothetical protein